MRRNCINKYMRRPIYIYATSWAALLNMKSNRNRISMLVFIGIALVVFRFLFYLETLNVNIESLLGICLIMSMSVITVKKENISLEIIFWRCSWCRFVHDKIMGFLPNKNRRNELLPQIFGRIVINGDIPIPYFPWWIITMGMVFRTYILK